MGVWTTGPRSRAQSLSNPGLRQNYGELLADWREEDVPGSPYAVGDYHVPAALGGDAGLEKLRDRLRGQGLSLVLDFVPNHVGMDHPWVRSRPEFFVQAPSERPDFFREETARGPRWLAHGKDPYFPGWTDTAQLDYRKPALHAAMGELLRSVAARCDGVRCDMAMLMLNDIFGRTWQQYPAELEGSSGPAQEFWVEAVRGVKEQHPGFLFLAEVYWGLEWRLQALGFDYTYDKTLYERLLSRDAAGVQAHLLGLGTEGAARGAHFLENHDEPRIAPLMSPPEQRAAALVILGLPGMSFLHEGQETGARRKVPVQMGRCGPEPEQPEIAGIYSRLLEVRQRTAIGKGKAEVLRPRATGPDNPTFSNFVIVQWQTRASEFDLVAVNLAPHRSQCWAPVSATGLARQNWTMKDLLGDEAYVRNGNDMAAQGLYLDLPAHGAQIFHFGV
jgi:Alpha amylase, catalytic domain